MEMHELGLTEELLNIALLEAQKVGAERIVEIKLKIGEFVNFDIECCRFYYNELSKGTIGEGAKIVGEYLPLVIICNSCNYRGGIEDFGFVCKNCGGKDLKVLQGEEFFIDNIEVIKKQNGV